MGAARVESSSETSLFDPSMLDRLTNWERGDNLTIRPLTSTDYDRGFVQLLGQLTDVGNINAEQFRNRFRGMKSAGGYYVVVVEDRSSGKVVGSATLVVEQKFIHNCALRGRLEDVVVNSDYRGKQLGQRLVSTISQLARRLRCYKLSLDCKDNLVAFYEKLGFRMEPGNANQLNARFHYDGAEQSHL